ncbi:uncharacterized protein LOC9652780 [Selaginella moellendorffii]|uniref:uncharacterized protein LOC9652780 n=1 Tax=Selaginella moellendorffii TaxID=88036 RepID=UPI000D1C4C65|nr:uncharacterized protein LOC9652780 [Selaginella moellendorffii]|eukprot:XP_024527250.1 uncharacterized protein LOC9652780 [Selaginella moellendorffii]
MRMALAGIAAAGAMAAGGVALWKFRPKDPIFEVTSIEFKGFQMRFCTDSPMLMAVIDVELVLSISVTNPNVAPIAYTSTTMDIFYHDTLLGQAKVDEGTQEADSTKILRVPAKLDGLQVTNHVKDLIKDVYKREMLLHSTVTICGAARVWKWRHKFEVHVDSDIKVDPIYLDVIEQENRVHMEMPLVAG